MNRDDITRLAREAGFVGFDGHNGALRRFAELVAAAEREACAVVCDAHEAWYWNAYKRGEPGTELLGSVYAEAASDCADQCAKAIRERIA